ncbi:hypothetical protein HELRODRAFT_138341, partial [Helobdella robusta]|uniref:GYF domain-containing protein n=1 Tax=Helobdella robusta TaxID=6412 RepID=T1EIU2_HELRO
ISWEFKWENKDEAECYGPYSSEQMLKWQDEGYFKDGVFVRKTTVDSKEFQSSKRIDFSLY